MGVDAWEWTRGRGRVGVDEWNLARGSGRVGVDAWKWTCESGHIGVDAWEWARGSGLCKASSRDRVGKRGNVLYYHIFFSVGVDMRISQAFIQSSLKNSDIINL